MELSLVISRRPFLKLLFWFMSGIYTSLLFGYLDAIYLIVLVFTGITLFVICCARPGFHTHWQSGLIAGLILFLAGALSMQLTNRAHQKIAAGCYNDLALVEIRDAVSITDKSVKSTAVIHYRIKNRAMIRDGQRIIVVFEKDSSSIVLKPGTVLLCKTDIRNISPPSNPFEFDYRKYMARKGVFNQAYLKSGTWRLFQQYKTFSPRVEALKIQQEILNQYRKIGLNNTYYSILSALTLGYKNDLEASTKHVFSETGVMHVMALSGFNVAVLVYAAGFLLFFTSWIKGGKLLKIAVILFLIWLFAFVTGLSPSVVRAAVMLSFVLTGNAISRRINTANILFISAFVMLAFSPSLITDISFQLSFAAVLGIIVFYPFFNRLNPFKNKMFQRIWQMFSVSCAAQFSTLPLTLYYFHQFPVYFWITNLFVIPLASCIICASGVYLLVSFFKPAALVAGKALTLLLKVLFGSLLLTEKLPFSVIENISVDFMQACIIAVFLILLAILMGHPKKHFLFVTAGCFVFFLLVTGMARSDSSSHDVLLIGKLRNHSVIHLITRNKCTVICDEPDKISETAMNYAFTGFRIHYRVAGNLSYLSGEQPFGYRSSFLGKNKLFRAGDKTVLLLNDSSILKWQAAIPLDIDVLIVTGSCDASDMIFTLFRPGIVITDSSVDYRQRSAWEKLCGKNGFEFYDVNRDGAYLLESI
ncbi:MAG TPA: ComEC/Rec2 family competence protein [Bacteroidales bacterium]|nr:ComEC/Rec2 family competence protein [Bacteroidales bacterium]